MAAAWELVREHGLAGLALRDLAERVGMKAPSLYSYFGSKLEIYDAMFHEGYLAFAVSPSCRHEFFQVIRHAGWTTGGSRILGREAPQFFLRAEG